MDTFDIHPIRDGDKIITIATPFGIDIWVDYDDVNHKKSLELAEDIARLPELLETEWMYDDLNK